MWWDRQIQAGAEFSNKIEREIETARTVVVLWSKASRESQWVRDEAAYARDRKKLVPVRIDNYEPPLGFRQIQTADLSSATSARPGAFDDLLTAIRRLIGERQPFQDVPQPSAASTPRAARRRLRKRALWITAGVAVAISLLVAYAVAQRNAATNDDVADASAQTSNSGGAHPVPAKSIAVLPFTDMSETKDQEYLADGMAEEIINLLANVPDLYVPARTSSFFFKGKPTQISEVARELGVAQVLEGSIRLAGNHLRVTAQLIRADSGYHVWSARYDRELRDIFQVQDEIANAVAEAMQIQLMGGTLTRRKGGTENLDAYRLYLRAVTARERHTRASIDESDDYLQQAVKLDPTYGMAWWMLGSNAVTRADSGFIPPKEGYERGRAIFQKVLELSPDNAPAYVGLLYVHRTLDWDWAAAQEAERRALAIDPTDPNALNYGGVVAATLGHWDEAERKILSAVARDPLDTFAIWGLVLTYYGAQRYTDAESAVRRVMELAPEFLWTHAYLGKTLLAEGKPQAALEMVQQESDEWVRLWFLPIVLRAVGRNDEADEALKTLIARTTPGSGPYFVAMNYSYRGDTDLAFEWLERAYRE